MKDLITAGKVYIAQPPLYKIKKGKEEFYAYDDKERTEILKRLKVNIKGNGKDKDEDPYVYRSPWQYRGRS